MQQSSSAAPSIGLHAAVNGSTVVNGDDTTAAASKAPAATQQADPRRWVALGQLSLLTCINCCQWIGIASIVDQSREFFSATDTQLNWLSVVYMLVYVTLEPVAVAVFVRFGLRRGLLTSSVLNTAGAALKLACALGRWGFAPLLAAQCISASAQIFSLGCPPLMSSSWFPPDERAVATSIASTSNELGNAIGRLVPPLLVTSASRGDFVLFFGLQLAVCAVDLLLNIFVVSPPPTAADETNAPESPSVGRLVFQGFKDLAGVMRNPAFALLALGCGLLFGAFWSSSTLAAQLLQPFGATEGQVGGMGFTSIAAGVAATMVAGRVVDRTRRYRFPTLAIFTSTLASAAALLAQLRWSPNPSIALMWFIYTVLGLVQTAVMPVVFEFGAELTYPMDASASGGMLMLVANAMAAVMVLVLTPVLGNTPSQGTALSVLAAYVIIYLVATLLVVSVPEKLLRLQAERREEVERASNDPNSQVTAASVAEPTTALLSGRPS